MLRLDNRARRPLPIRMEHSRSYLMDGCEVMASGSERPPTVVTQTPVPSSCNQKQASQSVSNKFARAYWIIHRLRAALVARTDEVIE
jgi:hypothetical protein